jgi:hypothetical protein
VPRVEGGWQALVVVVAGGGTATATPASIAMGALPAVAGPLETAVPVLTPVTHVQVAGQSASTVQLTGLAWQEPG